MSGSPETETPARGRGLWAFIQAVYWLPVAACALWASAISRFAARVQDLEGVAERQPEKARAILGQNVGDRIEVLYGPRKGHLVAVLEIESARLLIGNRRLPESLVAGACYPSEQYRSSSGWA